MELSKKSELTLGSASYVINTELAGEGSQSIRTQVLGSDGSVAFETSQDISALRPIFQNSQKVFERLEAQHQNVIKELKQGRLDDSQGAKPPAAELGALDRETDALEHAVSLLGGGNFEKATAALRAVLETYPHCSEARELLEVAYKASSGTGLPVDLVEALRRGTEAFAAGRQRDAIDSWKQCLIEEPGNRLLQLLVMLATTWSQERRQHYANEVLAAGSASLSAGRPEEAQALLLIAQTVEDGQSPAMPTTPPTIMTPAPAPPESPGTTSNLEPEPAQAPPPPAPRPPIDETAANLESLVPDPSETVVLTSETPTMDVPSIDDTPTILETTPPEPAAAAPPEVYVVPEISVVADHDAPAAPQIAAPNPPPSIGDPEPAAQAVQVPQEEDTSATMPPVSPRPAARRPLGRATSASLPMTRAKSASVPWPLIGGGVAALLVIITGIAVTWFLGGSAVPQDRLDQAANFVGNGEYVQAITAYDELIREFGDHAETYLGRGRARVASGDTEGGLGDLRRARDLDPDTTAVAEEIGDVYYSSGNYLEAIENYREAFASSPGSAEGRYRLAASFVERDNGDAALEHLRAAITADPKHGEAQFLYGDLLNERARFVEAEGALRAAEPHVEAGSDFLSELTIALLGQEKLDEAEEVARTFLRSYPSDARAHSLLGEVYLSRRQYEYARAQLIRALRTDRNEPRAQIALGRTWLAIGKTRGDRGDLAKARQVLTSATGVHEGQRLLALGQVSLAEGDLEGAERLLRQSLEHGAAELPVHLALAESKVRGEDLVGAAEEMQRASALAPEDPAISLSLAIAYSQLDEADRAAEQFLKSIQGIGLVTPPGPDAGPVMLPAPYIPLPERFDVNRAIRDAYQQVLKTRENDPSATELQTLAESTTFVLGSG